MTSTETTQEPRRCLGCRHLIRSAESLASGYGAGCRAKIRRAAKTADLSAWTESQAEDALQAIEDGAVVPSTREGVFHVVSTDGTEVHRTHRNGCTCTNSLLTRPVRPCYHRCAIAILLAASAPSTSKPSAPAPAAILVAAPADLLADLDRLTAAFMTAA